ncbi:MAG: hypothetical protein KDK51_06630 [Deltaproteobacteria bacterium]|nr:hypothetical protein [Deltaproteobacteria bacterium]
MIEPTLMPYLSLFIGALLLLIISLLRSPANPWKVILIASAFVFSAVLSMVALDVSFESIKGVLLYDKYGQWFGVLLLLLLLVHVWVVPFYSNTILVKPSIVIALLLISASGGLYMIFSNHLAMSFVGIELLWLPQYILIGVGNNQVKGSEAAFKCYLIGAVASALFLYGAGLVWASTGSLNMQEIYNIFQSPLTLTLPKTFWLGLALMIGSLLFRLGAFPFHLSAPDMYEAAPAVINPWLASSSMIAMVGFLLRFMQEVTIGQWNAINPATSGWAMTIGMLSVLSMYWGSLGSFSQRNVKRLLGYVTVTYVGYLLMFLSTSSGLSVHRCFQVLFFYVCIYGFTQCILFMTLAHTERFGEISLDYLKGVLAKSPVTASILIIGLFSLAGIPPLGGFMALFSLFYHVIEQGNVYLVLLAVLANVILLTGLLKIIGVLFSYDKSAVFASVVKRREPWVLSLLAFLIIAVGIMPHLITNWLR